jgi:N-6 DNA Methylase
MRSRLGRPRGEAVSDTTVGAASADRLHDVIDAWRRVASRTSVTWRGHTRPWIEHVERGGFDDEERLVGPAVFPVFASKLLGWDVGLTLYPELAGHEGRPDFTPADPVTHPFVFEIKGSRYGAALDDPVILSQVERYLVEGRPRIQKVVLTNLVGLRVFSLGPRGKAVELYSVSLRDLALLPDHLAGQTPAARNLARFVEEFSFKTLTTAEKLESIRKAEDWNAFSVTSSDWIIRRLERTVEVLHRDVVEQLPRLTDPAAVSDGEREAILQELHVLASRTAPNLERLPLDAFTSSAQGTPERLVLDQYTMHVAYYVATRLLLVRIWEDLKLLEPMLHDGGFDGQMARFEDDVSEVVAHAFRQAQSVYRALFNPSPNYAWFEPSHDVYVEVIYQLASTYLGAVDSDVLGQVYERLLSRIDRKLLGQYYTPRDVIALMWDLIGLEEVADEAELAGRGPRILDIATGSGGFLVEAARRLRERLQHQLEAGASVSPQEWLNAIAEDLIGVEIQYFSRYLAELNLLVQIGQVLSGERDLRIAPVGVIAADTLSLCQPQAQGQIIDVQSDQPTRARRLKDVVEADFAMDVACGNPPYIGERIAAPLLRRTREQYPYWQRFAAEHQDYLYMFLILGVSKLRAGGRFSFITTEYWLRAGGAHPLRLYLARNCAIERIVLFRDLRLFPDAPGQHSMIVSGRRVTEVSSEGREDLPSVRPRVSIYNGANVARERDREAIFDAMRTGSSSAQVQSFTATVSPNELAAAAWSQVILTRRQIEQRAKLRTAPQIAVVASKGVEPSVNTVTSRTAGLLTAATQQEVGWPDRQSGIQLLTSGEVAALGDLNETERGLLRPVVNTKDVYPYAAVLPDAPTYVIYLRKPDGIRSDEPLSVAQGIALPHGIPRLGAHLETFKAILQAAVVNRRERRPWWTLHRPRFDVIGPGSSERWEPYCLTTRWGGGNRLVVGLAPGGASPASGLHVLRGEDDPTDAALLAAIYNSSLLQTIVDSLPPGNLRAADIENIGAPALTGAARADLVDAAMELAEVVSSLVKTWGARFPLLPDRLRSDVTLADPCVEVWTPAVGPSTTWGHLSQVAWTKQVTAFRSQGRPIGEVAARRSLFGNTVEVTAAGGSQAAVRVELEDDVGEPASNAIVALLRGAAELRLQCREVSTMAVPTDVEALIAAFARDRQECLACVERYRSIRSRVDDLLSEALASRAG